MTNRTQNYADFLTKQARISHERVADSLTRALKEADAFESLFNILKEKFPERVAYSFIPPAMPKIVLSELEDAEWSFVWNYKSDKFTIVNNSGDYFFLENVPAGSEQTPVRIGIVWR